MSIARSSARSSPPRSRLAAPALGAVRANRYVEGSTRPSAQLPDKPMVLRELKGGVYSCTSELQPCPPAWWPTVSRTAVSVADRRTMRTVTHRRREHHPHRPRSMHGKPMYDNLLTVSRPTATRSRSPTRIMSGEHGAPGHRPPARRCASGRRPAGAHAISGAWRETAYTSTDNGLIMTITDDGKHARPIRRPDRLRLHRRPTAGLPVPVHGDADGRHGAGHPRRTPTTVRIAGLRGGKLTCSSTRSPCATPTATRVTMVVEDKRSELRSAEMRRDQAIASRTSPSRPREGP